MNFVHVILKVIAMAEYRPYSGAGDRERQQHQDILCCQSVMRNFDRSRLSHSASQDGFEKALETVLPSQRARPSNPPANDRKSGENDERNGHRWRRFVDVFLSVVVGVRVTEERKK